MCLAHAVVLARRKLLQRICEATESSSASIRCCSTCAIRRCIRADAEVRCTSLMGRSACRIRDAVESIAVRHWTKGQRSKRRRQVSSSRSPSSRALLPRRSHDEECLNKKPPTFEATLDFKYPSIIEFDAVQATNDETLYAIKRRPQLSRQGLRLLQCMSAFANTIDVLEQLEHRRVRRNFLKILTIMH